MGSSKALLTGIGFVALVSSSASWAQPNGDAAAAESLREEGSRLFKEGKYTQACPKLRASLDLRRSPFTAGRLAQCYEKIGRLASAWAQWRAVVVMIGASADPLDQQRKQIARQRAAELDTKVPRLTIQVSAERAVPGLEVRRGGELVAPAIWGSAVRVDAGSYEISASADGYRAWTQTIAVRDGRVEKVEIPRLDKSPIVVGPPEGPAKQARLERRDLLEAPPPVASGSRWVPRSTRAWVGVGVSAAGLAAVGLGSVFGLSAKGKRDDARALGCDNDNVCPDQSAAALLESARDRADLSTISLVVGVAAMAGGVTLWLTAPGRQDRSSTERPTSLRIEPALGPRSVGAAATGTF